MATVLPERKEDVPAIRADHAGCFSADTEAWLVEGVRRDR